MPDRNRPPLGLFGKQLSDAVTPYWVGTGKAAEHLLNPRPGYVNQSDGSVGILGKAFGSLGLDADGARGATGWEDAWRNSVDADTSGRQASMLPITSDGGYGVPTMLSAPLEGFNSMWERGDEANVLNPESLRQSSEESFDAAGLAATGGFAAGVAGGLPDNAVGMFGGKLAKTADHAALARAEEAWAGGADPERVWRDTGWFQGADGHPRFEIKDSGMRMRAPFIENGIPDAGIKGRLGELINHPDLFAAYPDMANSKVKFGAADGDPYAVTIPSSFGGRAAYEVHGNNSLRPEWTEAMLLHELQHGVQQHEGFATGSNPFLERIKTGLFDSDKAYDRYYNGMGEVEARNVESRHRYAGEQGRFPVAGESVPRDQQVQPASLSSLNPLNYFASQPKSGAVPEGAIAANGWGQKLKGWLGRNAEPIGSPPPESLSMSMSDSSGSQPNGLLRFGDWRAGQSSAEPAGVGRAFGAGRYQLARAPGRDHGDDLAFQILRDGDDFGTLDVRQIGPDSAHVIKMETSDGSNSVGLAGLRELREAFRDFEPSVTRFSGTRDNQFKTGSALDGFRSSGRAVERPQVLDLYSNSPTSAAAPLAVNALERKGIRAYHGSPHDFDKFSLDKIGTGEGAQAYGHGLYFAEEEAVAKAYRDQLGDYSKAVSWNGREAPTPQQQTLVDMLQGTNNVGEAMSINDLRNDLKRQAMGWRRMEFIDDATREARIAETNALYDELERSQGNISIKPPGHMYEVNINVDADQFLDWDAPLSQQPEAVRMLAEQRGLPLNWDETFSRPWLQRGDEFHIGDEDNYVMAPFGRVYPHERGSGYRGEVVARGGSSTSTFDDIEKAKAFVQSEMRTTSDRRKGSDLYSALAKDPVEASRLLREAGVPGLRYLDQGSRGGASRSGDELIGTRNAVIFDDSLVDINRKYANHPVSSAAPLAFTDNEDQPGLFARRPRPGLFQ